MCIGIPMQVIESWAGGVLAAGRGRSERVDTRLVGDDCPPGQWLLVFQGAARERLDAERAAEIEATLDLLEAALAGDASSSSRDPGFALPSSLSAQDIARITSASATLSADKS